MAGQSAAEKTASAASIRFPPGLTYGVLALLTAYGFVRSVVAAAGKPFWYDELLTRVVAAQGSWDGIVAALRAPTDGQPPLFYVVEHWASGLCANQQVALRLPAALGLACALLCVFAFARKWCGDLLALLCAGGLLVSCIFQTYAQEARPYGLVIALVALAMVCYQRAQSAKWLVLLGASLALAESLHYLAVLAMVPFGAAELYLTLLRRRMRWGVWAALAAGVIPLAIFWRLLQATKDYYGAHHYYAHFPFSAIPAMYTEFFGVNSLVGGAAGVAALVAVLLAAAKRNGQDREFLRSNEAGDAVLVLAFAALPYFAFAFARVTHSGMTPRYILAAVVGILLAFAYWAAQGSRQATVLAATFLLAAVGISELHFWRFQGSERRAVAGRGAETARFFESAGYRELPVVVPNGSTLLATVYYAFPERAGRFAYLRTERDANDPDHSDTTDKGLQQVSRYLPIQVEPAQAFLAGHARFLVYTEGSDVGKDRVSSAALHAGWSVRVVAFDGFRALYLVSRDREN
jgi:hypothetical protein